MNYDTIKDLYHKMFRYPGRAVSNRRFNKKGQEWLCMSWPDAWEVAYYRLHEDEDD